MAEATCNVKMMDKLGRQSNILILIFKNPFAGAELYANIRISRHPDGRMNILILILRASSAG